MNEKQNWKTGLACGSRWVVGLTLLVSSFTKVGDLEAFVNLLLQYGFPAMVWAAPVIAIVEAAAGICLLLGIYPRLTAAFSFGMIGVFSLAFLYGHLFRGVTDCKVGLLQWPPWATFVRNGVLLALLVVVWRFSEKVSTAARGRYLLAFAILLPVCFFSGYQFSHRKATPKVHPLYQRAVRETVLPQLMETSPDSTYLMIVFSYRCDGCWNYFENVKRYNDPAIADRLVVLAVGNDSTGVFNDYFLPDFEIREVDEKTVSQLTQVAPTMLYIASDTIRHVVQGAILTRRLFEKNYLETF
jgi:uncharacterized membrane protein YphA (DoxX/SURF4 family)